ncbi:MAG: glycosyltransferase family 1 protein [Candidatus Saccharimonadales bacterium]
MRLIVEADSVVAPRMSGVGHTTLEILRALDKCCATDSSLSVVAVVPFGSKQKINQYGFRHIRIKSLIPGGRLLNYLLARTSFPLPVDLLVGRGVYVFPNYKNWFVPFSFSVTFVHDLAFRALPGTVNAKNAQYLKKNMNRWLQRTSLVATVSAFSQKELARYYPKSAAKVRLVPNGVDPGVLSPQTAEVVQESIVRYKLPQEYFLVIGNIEPRKNIDRLLEAYRLYADSQADATPLVIAGAGGWKNEKTLETMKQMQSEGYGIYSPRQHVADADRPALYSGARAFVHVALYEGFGLPPLEAQSCGSPVIAAAIAPLKEFLNEHNTVFVDPLDVRAIAEALRHPPTRQAKLAQTEFTWDRTAKCLLDIAKIGGGKGVPRA